MWGQELEVWFWGSDGMKTGSDFLSLEYVMIQLDNLSAIPPCLKALPVQRNTPPLGCDYK